MKHEWLRWGVMVPWLAAGTASAQSSELLTAVRLHSPTARARADAERTACLKAQCPTLPQLTLLGGYLALSEGDAAGARKLLSSKAAPSGLEPWRDFYLGQSAFYVRAYADAATHFEKVVAAAPPSLKARAVARLGEAYLAAGNPAAAAPHLEAAANLQMSPELLSQRAAARQATGNKDGARADRVKLAVHHPAHPYGVASYDELMTARPRYRFDFQQRLTRARGWLNEGQPNEAMAELQRLEKEKLARGQTAKAQVAFTRAQTLFALRQDAEAEKALELAARGSKALAAEVMMLRARRALKRSERTKARDLMLELAEKFPREAPTEEALYLAGWLALQEEKHADAVTTFERFEKQRPRSRKLDDALWFKGLSQLQLGDHAAAQATLGAISSRFPNSSLVPQARYWSIRSQQLAGAEADVLAPAYATLVNIYPGSFYALLSQVRLAELGREVPVAFPNKPQQLKEKVPEELQQALALTRAGLFRDAADEVDAQLGRVRGSAMALKFGHALQGLGDYGSAYALAARHLWGPAFGEKKPEAIALLYPRAFRSAVEKEAAAQKVPVSLVWAIMRRESAFRPEVASAANARGLMQIIPPTANAIAQKLGDEVPPPDALFAPEVNIRYGAWYLSKLSERFGHPALVAAAYNAGPSAVLDWVKKAPQTPFDLFVELIPYRETRGYVKQVIADLHLYQSLYSEAGDLALLRAPLPQPSVEGVDF